METRCPYHDCKTVFKSDDRPDCIISQASNGLIRAVCPFCKNPCTLKPLELLEQMEKKQIYLAEQNSLQGGPCRSEDEVVPLRVLLEDLRSLQNIGSIFRTADAMGFGEIVLSGICGIPNRKDVVKASLGAEEYVSWRYAQDSLSVLKDLKARGVFLMGLELTEKSIDLNLLGQIYDWNVPLCLVLGNEVSGVSEEALNICDKVCHIPMKGAKESLNVAVAFGIAAYEISKMAVVSQKISIA